MGAKDWLLVFSDGDARKILRSRPVLDRALAASVAQRLYPDRVVTPIDDGSFDENLNPEDGEIYVAAYPGLVIVATTDVAEDFPSQISPALLTAIPAAEVYVHAQHSVVDWFAYAIWSQGTLRRALSLSPDSGILENIGTPLPFEAPYWAGERPVGDETDEDDEATEGGESEDEGYPLPFHPLELAEDALAELLGFQFEGDATDTAQLWDQPLAGFAVG